MMTSNFWKKVFVISGFLVVTGVNMDVTEAYRSNKYVDKGGCYLQKEYNYFMNQWTTNEVCKPKFVEVPVEEKIASPYSTSGNTDNIYMGPSYSNSYTAPVTYYKGPSLDAIHTANSRGNSWGGYGSASNYLLGSFGGGTSRTGYSNGYYPSAVSAYYPSYSGYGNYGYVDQGYWDWGLGYGYGYDDGISGINEYGEGTFLGYTEPDYYAMAQVYGQANGMSYDQVDSLYNQGFDGFNDGDYGIIVD